MEENVALDTSKQKQFVKSIKGIKKLIKKAEEEVPEKDVPKAQESKKSKRKRPERGLVYLSHIPHGFYEHEMTQYFKQFGAVSNVRVIRSKRTGNSKGFAFVEFKQPAVAEIVAETMNNYLMGKRLLKAAYIPPEKQRPNAKRKNWSRLNNPGTTDRLRQKKAYNEDRDKDGELARARKTYWTYKKNMKKLSDIGINYDFFTPVDIPEELKEKKETAKNEKKVDPKKDKTQPKKENKDPKKEKAELKKEKKDPKKEKKDPKKEKAEPVVNKNEQKQKQQKLKEAGVKLPENFIQLQQESDSDSSADFDSDDYSKMLENDSEVESGDESDSDDENEQDDDDDEEKESDDSAESDEFEITGSDDDSEVDESDEEEVIPPHKKGKGKLGPMAPPAPVKTNKQAKQISKAQQTSTSGQKGPIAPVQKASKVQVQKVSMAPELGKRKAQHKNASSTKKPKFEKQKQQPMKKQFKKKK